MSRKIPDTITEEEFHKTFNLAINGCRQIFSVQREALINRHFGKTDRNE